jgi:serine phosphatase RsbU (regulator of sigma subunit)
MPHVRLGDLGRILQPAFLSAGVGALVSGAYGINQWPEGFANTVFIGAIIGLYIYVCITIFKRVFRRFFDRLGPNARAVARAIIFLVGGLLGGALGLLSGVWLLGAPMTFRELLVGQGRGIVVVAAVTALVAGIAFRAFEILRTRLARTIEQLKEAEWAEKEIELARSIQTRLLPPPLVEDELFTIAACNLPARYVAGDFYDIVRLEDGSVVIAAADVAGKGLGASLIMASVKAVLPFVAREGAQQAMVTLNEKLVRELGRREFVALAFARFTPADGTLELLNAGFPDPYVVSGSGVRALVATGPRLPLGVRSGIAYETLRTNIARGERVVFVSDGIPEAPARGEPLGYERLVAILAATNGNVRGMEWLDHFIAEVHAIVDERIEDDWTAVVLHRA